MSYICDNKSINYVEYRQIFSDYILIYKNILIKKGLSSEQISVFIYFISFILEKHYFNCNYVIEKPTIVSLFDAIKFYLQKI